jgi:hypothetical protein
MQKDTEFECHPYPSMLLKSESIFCFVIWIINKIGQPKNKQP